LKNLAEKLLNDDILHGSESPITAFDMHASSRKEFVVFHLY